MNLLFVPDLASAKEFAKENDLDFVDYKNEEPMRGAELYKMGDVLVFSATELADFVGESLKRLNSKYLPTESWRDQRLWDEVAAKVEQIMEGGKNKWLAFIFTPTMGKMDGELCYIIDDVEERWLLRNLLKSNMIEKSVIYANETFRVMGHLVTSLPVDEVQLKGRIA
ncbi:MAG: hypothetical protein D6746_07165 [Bacteroidetes bacterium]|nr:MAG: hypothetical protein D6746_07165 [Bacteroidota bacterium]